MLSDDLRTAVGAVCPIISLTIGNTADRTTWKLEYAASATAAQQQAAQNVLASFVPLDASEQTAAQKIAAGLTVNSTSTPALDATYAIDEKAQAKIGWVATYILVNSRFPAALASLAWEDIGGAAHSFPSTASFMAFATAVGDYVCAVDLAAAQATPTWPAGTVTIP